MDRRFLIAAAVIALSPALALADSTATSTIEATLTRATDVVNVAGLQFGTFALNDGASGTLIVTPDGAASSTGGARALAGQGAALFELSGPTGTGFALKMPNMVQLSGQNGGTMTVTAFKTDCTGTQQFGAGAKTCAVGATLNMGANSIAGLYRGSFDVSVVYE